MILQAVMLCVAPAIFLFVDRRWEMDEVASDKEETVTQRATKVDLLTTRGSEVIQFGGGMVTDGSVSVSLSMSEVSDLLGCSSES